MKHIIQHWGWYGLWVLLFGGSCQSNLSSTEVSTTGTNASDPTAVATVKAIPRQPEYWVEKDNSKVGWYTFEQLKPLLYADNDTTYVVNFWATWCAPCVEELPAFQQLYKMYKGKKVHLLLVSLDFEKQLEKKLIPFLHKHQLQGEVVALSQKGMNDWIETIDKNWDGALPATLIYKGQRRQFYRQSFNYDELEIKLKRFMNLR